MYTSLTYQAQITSPFLCAEGTEFIPVFQMKTKMWEGNNLSGVSYLVS